MSRITRAGLLGLVLVAAVAADGRGAEPLLGACYCRAAGTLHCTGGLTESDCRRRCDEELCDEWFWKERLPCWNWGYGG